MGQCTPILHTLANVDMRRRATGAGAIITDAAKTVIVADAAGGAYEIIVRNIACLDIERAACPVALVSAFGRIAIAEQEGRGLALETSVGKGAQFSVWIPCADAAPATSGEPERR